MNILITGCAGFIGFHLCEHILNNTKYNLIGIDNLNDYYDVNLKRSRIKKLKNSKNFFFKKIDISNLSKLTKLFKEFNFLYVVNLAAQAGVRYSIKNPNTYFKSNLEGFYNIILLSQKSNIKHFIYASTSSVYGDQKKYPLEETMNTDFPLSFYAATKKSNEIIAHSFSYIYRLPTTGLRFFTVYGPYGRPDMALHLFTKNIIENKKINLFNYGNHQRDFTYVDDVVESILKVLEKPPKKKIPYNIFNIGGNRSYKLTKFVSIIEKNLSKKAKIIFKSLQIGDVVKTKASSKKLDKYINKNNYISLDIGIKYFINWYKKFYNER